MVIPINNNGNPLSDLLTSVNEQARNVAFNIRFNQMQNTVINRINEESEKIANVEGNQRELDALNKTIKNLSERRETVVAFAFTNEANDDRFSEIQTAATQTKTYFAIGDSDLSNISAEEVSAFEVNRQTIENIASRLVELSHPDFVDGNNVTRLRTQIDELLALTPVEGVLDDEGTSPTTNDNLLIVEKLDEIISTAAAAADTSSTLQVAAVGVIREIDEKLNDVNNDRREINVFRAGEIEFELQLLRSKYANFLRSVELSFEASSQSASALTEAMNLQRNPPQGSILSILT